jgi:hypothetical protein
MLRTYKALLRGNRLEWSGDAPECEGAEGPTSVLVTLLDEPSSDAVQADRGPRMAEALEKLAAIHALAEIENAADWEREIRQDRSLPDRET